MVRSFVLALLITGCSSSGIDNPDALDDIPPPPPPTNRDDVVDPPYDDTTDPDDSTPPDDQTDPPEDQTDPPEEPVDPPEEPTDPPEDQTDPPDPPAPTCPAGVICVDSFPYTDTNTTLGAPAQLDGYGCAPTTSEAGGEIVYQLEITEPGFLAITLSGMSGDVDIDAHLLGSLDSGDCVDRGHWDAASLVEPGTWYVVADSWADSNGIAYEGAYDIRFQLTTFDDYVTTGLDPIVLETSLTAFSNAWLDGETSKLNYTIADFTMPSNQRRLWMIDLADGELMFHEYVTHGSGSSDPNDVTMVAAMSNINGSHMSSLGLMRAAETYSGTYGYSMRLDGLEPGFNDAVRPRAIVFHGADYATQSFVDTYGVLGQSWGCPAVDYAIKDDLVDAMTGGGLYMSFFDDPAWLSGSSYL